jgi:hypothetical protein
MEKVIRDGFVAVLYSPGYGAGWYSWHGIPELIYDPVVVGMVEAKVSENNIVEYCHKKYDEDAYFGGAEDLTISWIVEGEKFVIEEYDGAESIRFKSDFEWISA